MAVILGARQAAATQVDPKRGEDAAGQVQRGFTLAAAPDPVLAVGAQLHVQVPGHGRLSHRPRSSVP